MSLTPDDLAAAGGALLGRQIEAPRATTVIRPPRRAISRLLRLHHAAYSFARTQHPALVHPETARALESALVHAMVTCLADGDPVPESLAGYSHSKVMERFGQILAREPESPRYLSEICEEAGVSERTLRVCCQEHLGMGPMRFLLLRRMHLARRALLHANSEATSVTAVAVDHGFWELGRFSVAYRSLFGESPSATLRRPREEPSRLPASPWDFAAAQSA